MDKAGLCTGRMVQGCKPNWRPLLHVVGEELAGHPRFEASYEMLLAAVVP